MKTRNAFVDRLQYYALRWVAFLLRMFPIDVNLRTGRWLGTLWWKFSPRHRERTQKHLKMAYGDEMSDADIEAMSLEVCRHWAMYAVEFLCAIQLLDEWNWPRYVRLNNLEEAVETLVDDQRALLLTGHYGNFELTAYVLAAIGFNMTAIMRPLDNPHINNYVVRERTRKGLSLLNKKNVTAETETILNNRGAIGLVADQDAGRKGVFVDFFGIKASTYKSIALLAMQHEVPIMVGYARRIGCRFQYEVGINRIIRPEEWRDRDDPMQWITQEYTTAIERFVRAAPEQYLWLHRRWKSRPHAERKAAERMKASASS